MSHLQQLLGRIGRTGEGISGIQTSLSRPLALGHLKHATLEALHLLMKTRGITVLASIPEQRKPFG